MRKQIAGALMVSLLIGSAPGWADTKNPAAALKSTAEERAQRRVFRDSIERAIDRTMEGAPSEGTLTAHERRDLDTRHAALRTDPVARGTGGVVMMLVGAAISIGATIYLVNKLKKDDTTPTPNPARP